MSVDHAEIFAGLDPSDTNGVVKAFAANSAYRAADWEELTTEENPYRRPVRPDDLAWLDYSKPMPVEKALKLSALLGHRMLRNAYDSDLLYLPPSAGPAAASDGAAFYCDRNRILTALAAPVLEQHLFTLLDGERKPLDTPDRSHLVEEVRQTAEQRAAEPGAAFQTALSTNDRKASATFTMLQLSAYLPAAKAAAGRASLGEFDAAHPGARLLLLDEYRDWAELHDTYRELLDGAGLKPTAAAYWQLYLGTSLARGNHLHWLARNRETYPEFLGALVHHKLDEAATAARFADVFEDGLGIRSELFGQLSAGDPESFAQLTEGLVAPLEARWGEQAVERFHRGFADARWFARLWDEDLSSQLAWADNIPLHQERAERINAHIEENGIEVDLDTFVESHEETSTTHVHDEHRLVMVERGDMHFWNNVTHKIELHEGDKVLIPETRLHGSTVLSGECTYHQPIIPEEMYQRF